MYWNVLKWCTYLLFNSNLRPRFQFCSNTRRHTHTHTPIVQLNVWPHIVSAQCSLTHTFYFILKFLAECITHYITLTGKVCELRSYCCCCCSMNPTSLYNLPDWSGFCTHINSRTTFYCSINRFNHFEWKIHWLCSIHLSIGAISFEYWTIFFLISWSISVCVWVWMHKDKIKLCSIDEKQ